jgi:hypothetical protein
VEEAQTNLLAQFGEGGWSFRPGNIIFDISAGLLHQFGLVIGRFQGMAAAAGPEPGLLGLGRLLEENYLRPPRSSRRAGWAAIYSGGTHSIKKGSILAFIVL